MLYRISFFPINCFVVLWFLHSRGPNYPFYPWHAQLTMEPWLHRSISAAALVPKHLITGHSRNDLQDSLWKHKTAWHKTSQRKPTGRALPNCLFALISGSYSGIVRGFSEQIIEVSITILHILPRDITAPKRFKLDLDISSATWFYATKRLFFFNAAKLLMDANSILAFLHWLPIMARVNYEILISSFNKVNDLHPANITEL